MNDILNFTPLQLDALKEASSISAGSASTALAQFVGKKVNMRPPDVVIVDKINKYCLPYSGGSYVFIMHSDIMMPEMDGFEATKVLKSRLETAVIPIMMLTAKKDVDSELKGIDMGVDDYMTKPFDGQRLLARVKMLLRRK